MKSCSLVVLACVLLASSATADKRNPIEKVNITVYYEALCGDSKTFIVNQIAPVWRDLRGVIRIKLVPYGKATHERVKNEWQFTCQHGPDECYANKMQSCILMDPNIFITDKMDFIVCLMDQTHPDKSLEMCAIQTGLSEHLEHIQTCTDGDQGSDLLARNGYKTNALSKPLSFVPTIVFNRVFNQENHDKALNDLKDVVCRLSVHIPPACYSLSYY